MANETKRVEPTMAEVEARIALQTRIEKAWSNAWDRAQRADDKAGRPYNRHVYAQRAHDAAAKVRGYCKSPSCKQHPKAVSP